MSNSVLASPVVRVAKEAEPRFDINAAHLNFPLGSGKGRNVKIRVETHSNGWQLFDGDTKLAIALENGLVSMFRNPGTLSAGEPVHRLPLIDSVFTQVNPRLFLMFPGGGRFVLVGADNKIHIWTKHMDAKRKIGHWRPEKISDDLLFEGDIVRWITSATLELVVPGDVPKRLQQRQEGRMRVPEWEIIH